MLHQTGTSNFSGAGFDVPVWFIEIRRELYQFIAIAYGFAYVSNYLIGKAALIASMSFSKRP